MYYCYVIYMYILYLYVIILPFGLLIRTITKEASLSEENVFVVVDPDTSTPVTYALVNSKNVTSRII